MIAVPGPRQAAKLAAEHHALDREIADLRSRMSGLTELPMSAKPYSSPSPRSMAAAKRTPSRSSPETCGLQLTVAQNRSSPSYKNELLRHIEPTDLQQIIDAQPLKDDLQFAAFPK